MFYSSYGVYPHTSEYLDKVPHFAHDKSLEDLCNASIDENMNPLVLDDLKQHLFGEVMVGFFYSGHGFLHSNVLAYAGITGFEELDGKKLAVVGGVITHPEVRKMGFGFLTVGSLKQTATLGKNINLHEHVGYVAKCNEKSAPLFAKLGFAAVGEEGDKQIMTSYISPDFIELLNKNKKPSKN